MMMHPITVQELHKARYRDLLKQTENWRPVRQAEAEQPVQPSLVKRIVAGVGTLISDTGHRLTEHYALLK
jgi:hypothetical protein